ncbi:MAG: undecaprenyldiphospho-muramoylpentapeptide beta-N-acetylglucosaminyltransferase [Actinomycetota bacterium]|nr:undecaprenyldiphospho-muramoylpentapeptide beta-N-acetylglucosaminyltransferase [Actinomycetota bacterium]MDH5224377.1 undecaprenyldiphospho-muramoylpentapeptide beta-N-acetylglucosaminyltransferase [Actinomycetota bacterium]MDH5313442.1 undecaprenyldiphospho-muramoylpentapeptide beta-N-acetylglucosaminyltransferase [Actinomycetota bacterium]
MRVLMSGGGTAGHVFPALAVAERLREAGHDVRFVGSASGQEASLVPAEGFVFVPVRVSSAQTRFSMHTAKAVWMSLAASRAVRSLVRSADVVVGIGGYASAPAILAARRSRTPIALIEQNAVPGVVNRFAARWARVVATTFEATAERLPRSTRVVRTGNPIRREIAEVAEQRGERRTDGLRVFDLEEGRVTVSVFGGSQGALQLDRTVAAAVADLADRADLQLLVATGPDHVDVLAPAVEVAGELLVRVEAFIERMDLALAVSDLAVARAGSGTVSELAAVGVPSILVPYPHATEQHQTANAREVERAGGADVVLESALSPGGFVERITALARDGARRSAMRDAMLSWSRPEADAAIAELVVEAAA